MKSIRAERLLAGLVPMVIVMILMGLCDSLPGLAPAARADDADAPRRRDAKPVRPRMEEMPPEQERRKRRPFDDADFGDAPGNVAADDQGGAERREGDRGDAAAFGPVRGPRRLGATFMPVPAAVREQIDLPAGVGLLIDAVEPDSPAATSGLKRFDILTRFNDQIVCNVDQLATLIRLRKPGPVPLTILRGGRERKLPVALLPVEPADDRAALAEVPGLPPRLGPGIAPGIPPGNLPADLQRQVEDLARRMQQSALGPVGATGHSRTSRVTTSPQGNERIDTESDGTTTIEIRQSAGRLTVEILGADGKKIHAGRIDTDAERRRVPEEYRARVERLLEEITGARR